MKNITLKIILIFILNFNVNVNAESIGESLIFDTVFDEHVSTLDPRFAGLVFSAKSHKKSIIAIKYNGEDGYFLTKNLIRDFDKYNISYTVMEQKSQPKNKVFIELRQDDNE